MVSSTIIIIITGILLIGTSLTIALVTKPSTKPTTNPPTTNPPTTNPPTTNPPTTNPPTTNPPTIAPTKVPTLAPDKIPPHTGSFIIPGYPKTVKPQVNQDHCCNYWCNPPIGNSFISENGIEWNTSKPIISRGSCTYNNQTYYSTGIRSVQPSNCTGCQSTGGTNPSYQPNNIPDIGNNIPDIGNIPINPSSIQGFNF
jgi:hypothetical protein